MFLSTSVLNNLMKKAYKTGLVVARTQDAQGNDWLYLAGSYWEVSVNKDFIPKKTLGDIITLIGELPRPGERFNPFRGILWKNNVCKLRAHFRTDDKNIKVLKSLKGVDITPEVPEE